MQPHIQQRWSRELVEELLFREFTKGEDVSGMLPPIPPTSSQQIYEFPDTAKQLFKFIEAGPTSALLSKTGNAPSTPMKTGNGAASSSAQPSQPATPAARTPLGKKPGQPGGGGPMPKPAIPAAPAFAEALPPQQQIIGAPKTPIAAKENMKLGQTTAKSTSTTPTASETAPSGTPATKKRRQEAPPVPSHVPSNSDIIRLGMDAQAARDAKNATAYAAASSKRQAAINRRVAAQDGIDPDFIFMQPAGDVPLDLMFAAFPTAEARLRAPRTDSGNWVNDTFSHDEELTYKHEMHFDRFGPSQAVILGGLPLPY